MTLNKSTNHGSSLRIEYFGKRSQYNKYHATIPSSTRMNGVIKSWPKMDVTVVLIRRELNAISYFLEPRLNQLNLAFQMNLVLQMNLVS
jgi:hypothetical protein